MDAFELLALAIVRDELAHRKGSSTIFELAGMLMDQLEPYLEMEVPADRAEELVRTLTYQESPLVNLGDGRIVDLAVLFDGVALPHRITTDEIAADRLDLLPDLAVLVGVAQADGGLHDVDGTPLALVTSVERGAGMEGSDATSQRLAGPSGWLAHLEAGATVMVTAAGGFLRVEDAVPPAHGASEEAVAGVEAAIDAHEPDQPIDGTPSDIAQVQAAGVVDGWWDPASGTPFGDVVAASTLAVSGDELGRAGAWERYAELSALLGPVARNRSLPPSTAMSLMEFVRSTGEGGEDGEDGDEIPMPSERLLRSLAEDPDLAEAVLTEVRWLAADRADGPDAARALVDAWVEALPMPEGRRSAGVLALRARWALASADIAGAERLTDLALRADPHCHLAAEVAVELAANAGDARRAASLLRRVRTQEDIELQRYEEALRALTPSVGRNDPCPCGSGRKYKQCHLGRMALDDGFVVAWVLDQARSHLHWSAPPNAAREALQDANLPAGLGEEDRWKAQSDLLLFEHGWIRRFLDERRTVLASEHIELLEAWIAESVADAFHVHDDGEGPIELVDIDRTSYEVGRNRGSEELGDGTQVWTRLVPCGDLWWSVGPNIELTQPADPDTVRAARAQSAPGSGLRAALTPAPTGPLAADGTPRVRASATVRFELHRTQLTEALDQTMERDDDGPGAGWVWRLALPNGAEARVSVIAFLTDVIADRPQELIDLSDRPDQLNVLTDSVGHLDATLDVVLAGLRGVGAEPEVTGRDLTPWRRVQALNDRGDLIRMIQDRLDDEWEDDWDDEDDEDDEDDVLDVQNR